MNFRLKLAIALSLFVFGLFLFSSSEVIGEGDFARRAAQILARFKSEPSVREVHRAAMKYALVSQGRILSLLGRARWAGWLPEFRFRYNRYVDDNRDTAFPTSTTPILTTQTTRLNHRFEFRATWNLDELIFNRNELSVYRELKRLVELRVDVLKETTKLYFERRRLQVELILNPPKTLLARVRKMLRLQEITAELDAFTGGFFSRRLKALGRSPY